MAYRCHPLPWHIVLFSMLPKPLRCAIYAEFLRQHRHLKKLPRTPYVSSCWIQWGTHPINGTPTLEVKKRGCSRYQKMHSLPLGYHITGKHIINLFYPRACHHDLKVRRFWAFRKGKMKRNEDIYLPGTPNRTQIFVFSGISVLGTEILKGDGNSRRGQKFVLWCFWDLNSHLNFNEPFLGSHYEKLVPWMAQRRAPHQFFPWNLAARLVFASALSASFQLAALKGRNLWLNLWVRNH